MNVFDLEMLYNKPMQDTYVKGVMANNMDKNFVQRIMANGPTMFNKNMDGTRSTHLMQSGDNYMFPKLINRGPALVRNQRGSGEGVALPNSGVAEWLANNYKRANQEQFKGE